MRIAGIMSGTSLDGIDVAIIDFADGRVQTLGHATTPYPTEVRARILAVSNADCHTREISRLGYVLAELYAAAVRETCSGAGIALESLAAVGCHGQTVYHEGFGVGANTLQLGEPAVIAERLGVTVVSNFRARDVAAGGSGAPLVPYVDQLLFASADSVRVALNIGGIANITVLAPGRPVIAFDTGPGNMVIDQLMEVYSKGRERFDRGGAIGASGRVDEGLLSEWMRDPYFSMTPPKTAGREQYGGAFVKLALATGISLEDLIATATAFTAASIAEAIRTQAEGVRTVIAAGGGVHNAFLMGRLAAELGNTVTLETTVAYGIDPDAKEAIAFAILAHETLQGRPGNLPSATGARRAVVLGSVTPA